MVVEEREDYLVLCANVLACYICKRKFKMHADKFFSLAFFLFSFKESTLFCFLLLQLQQKH